MIQYSNIYQQPCKIGFGELGKLITPELVKFLADKKYIVIFGHTKSGKFNIGKIIADKLGRRLIVSDHYQHLGWSENMYMIRSIVAATKSPLVIEGVQMSRLLRKGLERGDFFADVVIHTKINTRSLQSAYFRDNEASKFGRASAFNRNILDNIFDQWYRMQKAKYPDKMPVIIQMDTSFI